MILQMLITCLFVFSRGMTSEDLKLRENAPKDQYGRDKTLPKVKKNVLLRHMTFVVIYEQHVHSLN